MIVKCSCGEKLFREDLRCRDDSPKRFAALGGTAVLLVKDQAPRIRCARCNKVTVLLRVKV